MVGWFSLTEILVTGFSSSTIKESSLQYSRNVKYDKNNFSWAMTIICSSEIQIAAWRWAKTIVSKSQYRQTLNQSLMSVLCEFIYVWRSSRRHLLFFFWPLDGKDLLASNHSTLNFLILLYNHRMDKLFLPSIWQFSIIRHFHMTTGRTTIHTTNHSALRHSGSHIWSLVGFNFHTISSPLLQFSLKDTSWILPFIFRFRWMVTINTRNWSNVFPYMITGGNSSIPVLNQGTDYLILIWCHSMATSHTSNRSIFPCLWLSYR